MHEEDHVVAGELPDKFTIADYLENAQEIAGAGNSCDSFFVNVINFLGFVAGEHANANSCK